MLSSYANSNWGYGQETYKWSFEFPDFDLWALTLTFCMASVLSVLYMIYNKARSLDLANEHSLVVLFISEIDYDK